MAITTTVPNEFFYQLGLGAVDFSSDTFKIALIGGELSIDRDSHGTWGDISASEIAAGNGYTTGGQELTADTAWNQDDANDMGAMTWVDEVFTASGGSIADFTGAVIYDTSASNLIIAIIELGETVSVTTGNTFTFEDLEFFLLETSGAE